MASQPTTGPDPKSKRLSKFMPRRSSTLSSSVSPAPPPSNATPERTPAKSERTRMDKIMRRPSTSSTLASSSPPKPLAQNTPPKEPSTLRKVLQRSNTSASSIGSSPPNPLPESKVAGSRIPRRTSSTSIRAASPPTDASEADGAKPERSRMDKLLRRTPSSSSINSVTPTNIPEPMGVKSERSRVDKILRRSPSSSSSLAISASPETQDVTPSKPESKRKRISSILRRPEAASSSESVAASEAGVEDGSPKPKRTRPGAVLRTLSAFSIKQRHGSSSSESLAIDTHAPTPPAQPSSEHKMLSPVAESPAVEQRQPGFASLPMLAGVIAPPPASSSGDPAAAPAPEVTTTAATPNEPADSSEQSPFVEPDAPATAPQLDLPPGLTAEPQSSDDSAAAVTGDIGAEAPAVDVADEVVQSDSPAVAAKLLPFDGPAVPVYHDNAVKEPHDVVSTEEPVSSAESMVVDAPAVPAIPQDEGSTALDVTSPTPETSSEHVENSVVSGAEVPAVVVQPVASDDASVRSASDVDEANSSVEATKATSFVDPPLTRDTEPTHKSAEASSTMGFEQFGWLMHHAPGEHKPYFTLRGHDVVTDVDLRREGAILSIYERLSCLDMPPPAGWELWLLDTVGGFVPAPDHYLVHHDLRTVCSTPASVKPTAAEREKYWEFVEKHPVHCANIISSEEIVAGTNDALTYEFVKWPVPAGSDSDSDVPFNEDESDEFSRSLSSYGVDSPDDMVIVAQNVAKVELRLCQWEQRMRESGRLGEERDDTRAGALVLSPDAQRQMIPALSRVLGGNVGRSGAWGCSIQ